MSLYAIHKQAAPPSGVSHCISARLTPSCLLQQQQQQQHDSSHKTARIVRNLVTARSNYLQVFEVVEELLDEGHDHEEDGGSAREKKNGFTDGDSDDKAAIHGGGTSNTANSPSATARLQFVREHRLHGTITGIQRIQTIDTARDGLDRLLISFKDAKVSLLEWSSDLYDLVSVSLHTFERLPQVAQGDLRGYQAVFRTDPLSRCSGLLLPQDALAITPFFQDQIELEGADAADVASLPYAPSFVIELLEVSSQLRNVIDFVFLAGFNEPTIAILSQPTQTWTSRLENAKDTVQLFLITLDVTSTPPSSTIISTTASLPYDSLYLTVCPKDLGGVLVTTSNAIIHIDQAGKKTGLAFNGWANAVTEMSKTDLIADDEALALEGSRILFILAEVALLFLHDGDVRAIRVQRDGRTISKLVLLPDQLSCTVPPSDVELVRSHLSQRAADGSTQACYVFVASVLGDSEIIRADFRTVYSADMNGSDAVPDIKLESVQATTPMQVDEDEDDDDDIDIYGSADAKAEALNAESVARIAAATRLVVETASCQRLSAYGPIRSAVLGTVEQDAPAELVACTGDEASGGLTILHRSFLPSNRRRVNLDHSTERLWSFRAKQMDGELEYKTYFFTSSEGETQIYTLDNDLMEPDYVKTFAKTTLSAGTLLSDTYIVYLLSNSLVVLNGDLSERQRLALPEGSEARSAVFADPYVLVSTNEAVPLLFCVSPEAGRLESSSLPDSVDTATVATLYQPSSSAFKPRRRKVRPRATLMTVQQQQSGEQDMLSVGNNDDDIYGESLASVQQPSSKQPDMATVKTEPDEADGDLPDTDEQSPIWCCTCSSTGIFSIYALPSHALLFRAAEAFTAPMFFCDSRLNESEDDIPEDAKLDYLSITDIGKDRSRPHLTLLMEDGSLAIYEAVPDFGYTAYGNTSERTLGLRWLKVHSRTLGAAKTRPSNADDDSLGPAERRLIPFADLGGHSGLLISGESPLWLFAEDTAPSRLFESAIKPVYGFTAQSDAQSTSLAGQCLISTGEEAFIAEMSPTIRLDRDIPFTKVLQKRLYTDIVFDQPSRSFVAAAAFSAPFEIFNDEGEPINHTTGEKLLEPTATRSALELIEPGSWRTLDGYEFSQYETVLSMATVTLETKSTVSGYKDYIGVGTVISRAEDLAARGALYVFEVVSVEPGPGEAVARRELRLLFTEELKSAATAVAGLNGYLVHAVGLKIYAKAFEQDERLLSVGFLDVGTYTSCIRSLKNLVLLGDAAQGLNFIAFQEEPYKLVSLGREVRGNPVVTADFLVSENKSAFVSTDRHGVVRLYEYDPMRVETQAGQRLLPRIEFRYGAEASASISFARTGAGDAKQNGLLYFHIDGSLSTIVPVRDAVYKRLQLLERQLIRHTHHFAGLNPRAFRTVRNDFIPRPLTKGLLDGDLLATYSLLSTQKQQQLADPLGSDADTINYNLRSLRAPW